MIAASTDDDMAWCDPCPAQNRAIDRASRAMAASELVVINGAMGSGRSLILRALRRRHGGTLITPGDLPALTAGRSARRYEQTFFELVRAALADHTVVYLDDVTGFQLADRQGGYNRRGLVSAALRAFRDVAAAQGKRIVAATDALEPEERLMHQASGSSWDDKGIVIDIPALAEADYAHILAVHLGARRMAGIHVPHLFASSRRQTAKSLTLAARVLAARGDPHPSVDDLLDLLEAEETHGSVDLTEVDAVAFDTLVGVKEIAARIDRAILLPLDEPDVARELRLEPKHGVLLHGPPGTGKTTIGRALAHRMRGRFFLVDGDVVHDGPGFQAQVDAVFAAAVRNSPSVIFIDDADVILSDPAMQHFSRYLLTRLDGLQSQSLANVCVVMTAMNIASMPPALLRSGRLELWIRMSLPDHEARVQMMVSHAGRLPFGKASDAVTEHATTLVTATEGFTPADLRRLVGDAAGRLAFDRHRGRPEASFDHYLHEAAAAVAAQKALGEAAMGSRGGLRFY